MGRTRRAAGPRVARLGAALAVAAPAVASACPVCFGAAGERVLHSYYVTAAVLTLLPLLLVCGFIAWLARQGYGRTTAGETNDARPPASVDHPGS